MLIQTGGHEIFLTENQKFMEKAIDDGVEVTMTVYPDMPHDFVSCLPDLDASVASRDVCQAAFLAQYIRLCGWNAGETIWIRDGRQHILAAISGDSCIFFAIVGLYPSDNLFK